VAALAETGLRSAALHRRALLLSLVLALGLLGAGVAAITQQGQAQDQLSKLKQEQPAQKPRSRTDRHGDPLPDGALARLGTLRWRAAGEVEALAYSPDGKTIVAASREGVCLFNTDGKLTKLLRPSGNRVVYSAGRDPGERSGSPARAGNRKGTALRG
jgi:hypothetical protein